MKLLFIVNTPPPYQGTTIMNKYLLDYLNRVNVDFIHFPVQGATSVKNIGKFDVKKITSSFSILGNIIKYRKQYDCAYLVMSVDGFAFYRHCIFILLLKLLGKKCILHLRGLGFRNKEGLSKYLAKTVFDCSTLIQHSPLNSFDIIKYQYSGKVFYVPNGWDDYYDGYKSNIVSRKKKQYPTDQIDIVFLSNLIESKGLFTVLESIKLINQKPNHLAKFHFIGNWESDLTKEKFFDFVKANSLNSFIGNVGPLFGSEKYNFLSTMDILVFPTFYKHETWGNVILEAMMLEIPVIASNYVAIPEMIKDGVNGFLIESKDSKTLAERIIYLIENNETRINMGEVNRQIFLERFTLEKFELNMMSIFTELGL